MQSLLPSTKPSCSKLTAYLEAITVNVTAHLMPVVICCLNPDCQNPPCPDDTKFCPSCGIPLLVLRRYRPLRRLGGGGFGKTYLAQDVEKFNEPCVIKQFAPQVQGTSALQIATRLFEEEAKRLQQLGEHRQIPTLLAYFEEDKRLYLVQQYIEGQSLLDELEQQGAFSEQKIRELLLDLLDILKSVHEQNVIHRDIKPENILRRIPPQSPPYQGRARGGQLVLIDFGASKQLTATVITKPGTSIGSFGYAPPEQMEDRQVYPASDLYSLGVTCFHLLTGIDPWELWKKQGYGWINNWRQHLRQPVSQELEPILDKLLQEDYQQRYQSVEEVLEDLNSQPPLQPRVPLEVPVPPQPLPSLQPRVPLEVPVPPQPLPPLQPRVPLEASVPPQSLPPVVSHKHDAKLKNPFLVGGVILLLGLGGYGVSYITTHLPVKTATYEKLALATTLTGHSNWVNSVAISPDGQTLASGSSDGTIKIWNLQTGALKTTLSEGTVPVNSVAISPDGETLVSGSLDIKIWNLQTGALKTTLTGHSSWVNSVAISADGQTLASGSSDGTIMIWNLQTGALKTPLTGHSSQVSSVAISRDGQTLVSGSGASLSADSSDIIQIWNLKTGELKTTLTNHTDKVNSVAISPDGQTLVSASRDETIKIWNLQTGELKTTLTGYSSGVGSVAISPDGQTLMSGSGDKMIKIWNLQTGQLKTTLTGHTSGVGSIAISPDGRTLVSGSEDNTIKIWRVPK